MSRMRKRYGRELALLTTPFILAAVVGAFVWKRSQGAPRLLSSPTPIRNTYWTKDGKVVGFWQERDKKMRGTSNRFFMWEPTSGELLTDIKRDGNFPTIYPSPDGKIWATVEFQRSAPPKLSLLDTTQGFSAINESPLNAQSGHLLNWLDSNRILDIANNASNPATVWNTQTMSEEKTESQRLSRSLPWLGKDNGNGNGIEFFQLSPDGKKALVKEMGKILEKKEAPSGSDEGYAGNRLTLISWPDCRIIKQYDGDLWTAVNWSKDGKETFSVAMTCAGRQFIKAEIDRYNLATKQSTVTNLDIPASDINQVTQWSSIPVQSARFTPDNRFLLLPMIDTNNWGWQMLNVSTGKLHNVLSTPPQRQVNAAYWSGSQFSPDGRYFLQPIETGVQIYDLNQFVTQN